MKKIMVFGFFLLLLGPNLLSLLFENRGDQVNTEKRKLAEWPAFAMDTLSEYPSRVEAYLNDHAPFRTGFLDLYARLNLEVFDSIDSPDVIKGKDGWLFYTGNESVDDYIGTNLFRPEELERVLSGLLELRERYAGGREFVFVIAPNKEIVYSQYMPEDYPLSHDNGKAWQLVRYIREHSDIKVIYPLELLQKQGREQPLYYKTDTHWNYAGGFAAAQEVIGAAGGMTRGLKDITVVYEPGEVGDLGDLFHMPASYCDDQEARLQDYFEEARPETVVNEGGILRVETDRAPDARKLVMIRDSFGLGMIPTFSRYFEDSVYIEWQAAEPELLKEEEGDVFVHEIVERNLGRILLDLDQFLGK